MREHPGSESIDAVITPFVVHRRSWCVPTLIVQNAPGVPGPSLYSGGTPSEITESLPNDRMAFPVLSMTCSNVTFLAALLTGWETTNPSEVGRNSIPNPEASRIARTNLRSGLKTLIAE